MIAPVECRLIALMFTIKETLISLTSHCFSLKLFKSPVLEKVICWLLVFRHISRAIDYTLSYNSVNLLLIVVQRPPIIRNGLVSWGCDNMTELGIWESVPSTDKPIPFVIIWVDRAETKEHRSRGPRTHINLTKRTRSRIKSINNHVVLIVAKVIDAEVNTTDQVWLTNNATIEETWIENLSWFKYSSKGKRGIHNVNERSWKLSLVLLVIRSL